jgi:NADH dehydrogenase [ubiquinone] 1 alpha subcomplex assembly factor 5
MDEAVAPPEIFDRQRRKALSARAARRSGERFLWRYVADELTERLALVSRRFEHALIVGPMAGYAAAIIADRSCALTFSSLTDAAMAETIIADEDRLPFGPASFDLVIAAGTLDSVNDLPGALVQIRRVLKPDGLFLGHMFGAGSLAMLKSVMMAADGNAAAPHIHPQIDLRSAADLLARAGFALPVADGDTMTVRYKNWRSIVADIRDAGVGNALAGPRRYPGKDMPARLDAEWLRRADPAGKLEEQFVHLFLSGWAPSPDQPKPAERGSGAVSLASVLSPTTKR